MTFDAQVTTITQNEIVPKVVDQQLTGNVLALILLANSQPWAGVTLDIPVKVASHTQGGSFNDYGEFQTSNENVRQLASFDPRAYYQSVTIGGIARSVNEISKTGLLNLVKVEMESVSQDMTDDIGTLLHGTGSNGTDFLGLAAGIDDGTNVATYGGLSRSTYTSWASTIQTSTGAFDFSKARTLANSATRGGQKPRIYVCDETTFGYIESDYTASVQGNYNLIEGSRAKLTNKGIIPAMREALTGQQGYDALYYGGSPIVKDEKAVAQRLSAVNTEFFNFYGVKAAGATAIDLKSQYHSANDYDGVPSSLGFAWTGFVRPAKQYAFIGQFLLIGNAINKAPNLGSSSSGISS